MKIIKSNRLRKGDLIGLVAPASAPSAEEKIEKSVVYLERLGYRVRTGEHVREIHGYFAGKDEDRASDFNNMIRDKKVRAIFCIRGGYGTPRLLGTIDYRALKADPKIIAGYSDITALQLSIFKKTGLITFSGPMPGVEMWKGMDPYTEEHFWRVITSPDKIGVMKNPEDEPLTVINRGKADGRMIGGNFALLACLMGTPYQPEFRNSILVLEDVDEAPHRIDRMLAQLFNAGILKKLKAIVFGKFTECTPSDAAEPYLDVDQVLKEYAQKVKCPVITNFQYGHIPRKLTIPIGLKVKLDTERQRIEVLEGAVK